MENIACKINDFLYNIDVTILNDLLPFVLLIGHIAMLMLLIWIIYNIISNIIKLFK